ncbi:MAG: hypothetical protein K2X66_18300 [Cyanobacteria bacterium]|nr:hypothetical protein [Cyanobacteriota bacterium]
MRLFGNKGEPSLFLSFPQKGVKRDAPALRHDSRLQFSASYFRVPLKFSGSVPEDVFESEERDTAFFEEKDAWGRNHLHLAAMTGATET